MSQTKTQQATRTEISYPNRYKVVIFNDDYTPMEFVIQLLIEIFNKDIETAKNMTLDIHEKGKCTVGIYSMEIAEQKVSEALVMVGYHGYPLKIIADPI